MSYRDYQTEINSVLIKNLHAAVSDELAFYLKAPVFLDEERMGPGYLFNEGIATALCQSLCMILVFTPSYFDLEKTYCAREYKAMVNLEENRFAAITDTDLKRKGLIFPVVIRGYEDLPPEIKDKRLAMNFENITLGEPEIRRHPAYAAKIRDIAKHIAALYTAFANLPGDSADCNNYSLPAAELEWISQVRSPASSFPLR